jgi:hypothetical protein
MTNNELKERIYEESIKINKIKIKSYNICNEIILSEDTLCNHNWVKYIGLNQIDEMCTKCNKIRPYKEII